MKRQYNWKIVVFILILMVPVLAWTDISGQSINPQYVKRIKDGQTSKNEIMLLFGEPQEVKRTPEGVIFIYRSYTQATLARFPKKREIDEQSTVPYIIDEKKNIKKPKEGSAEKILHSTLVVRFKPKSSTVASHCYTVHQAKGRTSAR